MKTKIIIRLLRCSPNVQAAIALIIAAVLTALLQNI